MEVTVPNCGSIGVIKDLSEHELPLQAWTNAENVRFLDGYAHQFLGHGQVYNTPTHAPQYIMQVNVVGVRYWLYATATKQFVVTNSGGVTTHTDITHATARAGVVNQWSGFVFAGIPVLNVGDTSKIPMYWDQVLANKFLDLPAWPAATYCACLCKFKNFMVALNITKTTTNYPYMVKWSSPAVPGALPASWDHTDATQDAGEFDLVDNQEPITWGLGLKDTLIVYKPSSTHGIDYIGGAFILKPRKILGMSGILNKNCAVDLDTMHFVVTSSDIVMHNGYSAVSVLDKLDRRAFFQSIDVANRGMVFCFVNPFLNEVFVAYPSIGATSCNSALVYNYKDKTVSFRSLPNINHAACGPVDNSLGGNWNQDSDAWDADLTAWNGPDFTPDTVRVLMASADIKLFMLDASATFDGVLADAFMERRGLSMGMPERLKTVIGIRLRVKGSVGQTITVKVGATMGDPYADPTYTEMTHTIGTTFTCDCFVTGRYIAVWIGSGTAAQWRLDSFDLLYEDGGEF